MSGLISNASQYLTNLVITPQRSIGYIIPDCAVSETHSDRLVTTQHPIQVGANITDHVYKLPTEIQLHWAWSNSSPANALASGIGPAGVLGFGSESYAKDIYAALKQLQVSGQPFALSTGKAYHPVCVLSLLAEHTDERSEYALIIDATVTEILIAQTQSATAPTQSQQANPEETSPQQNPGPQQPQPRDSLLYQGFGGGNEPPVTGTVTVTAGQ